MSLPLYMPAKVHLLQKRRLAIQHAQLLCARYEKTKECEVAWDYVDDLSKAIHKLDERVITCEETELLKKVSREEEDARRVERAQRMYDV